MKNKAFDYGNTAMQNKTYNALVVSETGDNTYRMVIEKQQTADLPPGDLLIRVHYSSLNYKDALSASGNRGVTRHYPHVPGIDAAGIVEQSSSPAFKPGDRVIAAGFDLGMNTPGGFGSYIRVPAAWVLHCPDGLTLRQSMIYGTAGFTAAQSVERLTKFPIGPDRGKILVTGATGGVGATAIGPPCPLGLPGHRRERKTGGRGLSGTPGSLGGHFASAGYKFLWQAAAERKMGRRH